MSADRIVERSTNYGRTWFPVELVSPRSPLASYLGALKAHDVYDDGQGNLYRWRAEVKS